METLENTVDTANIQERLLKLDEREQQQQQRDVDAYLDDAARRAAGVPQRNAPDTQLRCLHGVRLAAANAHHAATCARAHTMSYTSHRQCKRDVIISNIQTAIN